ncbi:MAG: hypothetical protein ACI4TU_11145 [Candidatus Cryptobacteroides sp.]
MKNWLLTLLASLLSCIAVCGQDRVAFDVEDIFRGKVVPKREMKKISVQGDRLAALRLSDFTSVQFPADEQRVELVSSIIDEFAKRISDKDLERNGNLLTYALLTLPPSDEGLNRYLGYSAKSDGRMYSVIVIYFCGQASPSELKNKLDK